MAIRDVISASSGPDAYGVVELSPFDFLDRLPDLALPPVSPVRGRPTDWGEIVQADDGPGNLFRRRIDELPAIDIHIL